MIGETLAFLRRYLDQCLAGDAPDDPQHDRVAFIAKETGEAVQFTPNAINLLLLNVEEERATRDPDLYAPWNDPGAAGGLAGPRLLLYLLIVAPFADYATGWRQLSKVLTHLHGERVIAGRPELPPGIDKLICELVRLSFAEQNAIWGVLRAAYRSSVLYRVRLVPSRAGADRRPVPPPVQQPAQGSDASVQQTGAVGPRPDGAMPAVLPPATPAKLPVQVAPARADAGA